MQFFFGFSFLFGERQTSIVCKILQMAGGAAGQNNVSLVLVAIAGFFCVVGIIIGKGMCLGCCYRACFDGAGAGIVLFAGSQA